MDTLIDPEMGKKFLVNGIVFKQYSVHDLNRKPLKNCMGLLFHFLKNFRSTKILKKEFVGNIGQKAVNFQVKSFSIIKDILFISLTFLPGFFIFHGKFKGGNTHPIRLQKENNNGCPENFFWEIFYYFLKLVKHTHSLKVLLIIGRNLISKHFKVTFFTYKLEKKIFEFAKKNQSLEIRIHSLLLLKEIQIKSRRTKKKKFFEQIFELTRFIKEKTSCYLFYRMGLEIFSFLPKKDGIRFIKDRTCSIGSQRESRDKKKNQKVIRENLQNLKFLFLFIIEKFQKNLVLVYNIFFISIWKSFFSHKKNKIFLKLETCFGNLNRHIIEINTNWLFLNSLRCMKLRESKNLYKKNNKIVPCLKIENFFFREKKSFMLTKTNWCKNFVLLKNFENKGIDQKKNSKRNVKKFIKIKIIKYYIASDNVLKNFC